MVTSHKAEFMDFLRKTTPGMIRDFYRELKPDVVRWGDKNPHYASPDNEGTLPMIAELYPRSQFVHIVRDGRDVVSSLIRKRKPNGDPWIDFAGAHRVWTGHVDVATEFCASMPEDRAFELRYEDLITDDLAWAERVISFLGLEMTPKIEAFCLSQQKERTPLSGPTRDLADVGQSDWDTVLSRDEQRASLELIGDHLVRYGYETPESLTALRSDP
jgi:hypothetical protein